VKAGLGVGALPRIEGDRHPDLQLCIPVMAGASQFIWLVMRQDSRKDPAVSALADIVIERVSTLKSAFAGVGSGQ
jgi:DNA-binding transcriptional LysR family regulator